MDNHCLNAAPPPGLQEKVPDEFKAVKDKVPLPEPHPALTQLSLNLIQLPSALSLLGWEGLAGSRR